MAILMFVVGHYTYSKVPLFNWIKDTFDLKEITTIGWTFIELDSTEAIKQAVLTGEYISFVSKRTIQMETKFGEIQVLRGKD
jgi:DNA-binding transcriptional LysR family regulator